MNIVEYLIPFDTSNDICKDVSSFNSLVQIHSDLKIRGDEICFKGSDYSYSIEGIEVENKNTTVFHITLSTQRHTDKFSEMLRALCKALGSYLESEIQVIRDDISLKRASELYPKINKLENLMRKLISKYMLINLGVDWSTKTVPHEVQDSLKRISHKKDKVKSSSILFELDFIQLSSYMFTPYALKKVEKDLPEKIQKILDEGESEKIAKTLKDYIQKNNWDRYFSDILNIDSDQLQKLWRELYELRNKVAHNRILTDQDLSNGIEKINKVSEILEEAFVQLSNIEIPDDDIDEVSIKTVAIGTNAYMYENSFSSGSIIADLNNSTQLGLIDDGLIYSTLPASEIHYNKYGIGSGAIFEDEFNRNLGILNTSNVILTDSSIRANLLDSDLDAHINYSDLINDEEE